MPTRADQVRAEYAAMPWYRQAGTAGTDVVRLASNGLFSLGDRLAATTSDASGDYAARLAVEQAKTRDAATRAGVAGDAAGVLGAGGAIAKGGQALWQGAKVLPAAARFVGRNWKTALGVGVGAGATLESYLRRTAGENPAPPAAQNNRPSLGDKLKTGGPPSAPAAVVDPWDRAPAPGKISVKQYLESMRGVTPSQLESMAAMVPRPAHGNNALIDTLRSEIDRDYAIASSRPGADQAKLRQMRFAKLMQLTGNMYTVPGGEDGGN